jgi:hypothetical protein
VLQGSNIFTGLQVHAKDFTDASIAAGKRVVIIGAGKTALVGPGRTPPCPALAWGAVNCTHPVLACSQHAQWGGLHACHRFMPPSAAVGARQQYTVMSVPCGGLWQHTPAPPMCATVSP